MQREVETKGSICGTRCQARYVMTAMASIGMGIVYGLKVALHVAIVAMVNNTAVNTHDISKTHHSILNSSCAFADEDLNQTQHTEDGPFEWSHSAQGLILSSYFWGYIVSQLPGGRMAEVLSAKWVMFSCVAINVVCCLLTPVMATSTGIWGILIMRILMGVGGGFSIPANHVMVANWAPPNERSMITSIIYAGASLGTVVFMLLSGLIAGGIGWQAVFYIEGVLSIIWLILWVVLIADNPEVQSMISLEERKYIMSSLQNEHGGKHLKMPWKSVFLSLPFWAIVIAHTCNNWGWYMVLVELPQYMKQVLKFNINQNAVFTSLPFFTMWIFSIVFGKSLDVLREKGKITTTWARKLATLAAATIPMLCFFSLCFVECNRSLAIALMTIAVTFTGGMFCGYLGNHIDIAPNFAGTLVALTNTVATVPGILVPIVVGVLTDGDPSIASWRIIFVITISLYVIEIIVYTIFASGEVQKWNNPQKDEPNESQPLKG